MNSGIRSIPRVAPKAESEAEMKIIHTSDLHLGSALSARLSPEKARERRRELSRIFGRLIDEAKRVGARAVIIAGDLFDTENPSGREVDDLLFRIEAEKGITFFYLPGNHEGELIRASSLPLPKNLLLFGKEWTYYDTDKLSIIGRSECTRDMISTLHLRPERRNIIVLHGELRDTGGDMQIKRGDFKDSAADYLALGHYHSYKAEKLGERCTAVYSGTPEGRGFDEASECGYVLIDTDGDRITHSFVPFAKRRIRILEVSLDGITRPSEIEYLCEAALKDIPKEDIVRVSLVGGIPPDIRIDTEAIPERFGDSFFHFEAEDKTKLQINPDDYKNDRSVKGEFVRRVINDTTLDEQTKRAVIGCGLCALTGESYYKI